MTAAIHMTKRIPPIDWAGVPLSYVGKCSCVCRTEQECREVVRWFGSAEFCPLLPIMVMVPGADAPTLIPGMGYATAAELQDCAVVAWNKQTERLKDGGKLFDFDALREKRGLMRREDVDAATRQAFHERIARHKANLVSDPFRVPERENPTEKKLFALPEEAKI